MVSKRSVYVDLGANIGDTVHAELATRRHDAVWAFEPHPRLAAHLRARFPRLVNVIEKAAWIADGQTSLYLGHDLSSTIVEGKVALAGFPEFAIDYSASATVETVDFSRWLRENIARSDHLILKVDIEGAEYRLLEYLVESGEIDLVTELRCEFHCDRFPQFILQHDRILESVSRRTKLVP